MKTTYRLNTRTIVTSTLAVILALSSTAALGRAMSGPGDDDDDSDIKNGACAAVGCANGGRACAEIGGKLGVVVPPFIGEVNVKWNCYEAVVK